MTFIHQNLSPSVVQNNNDDPTAATRKRDHIELAFQSQIQTTQLDERFYYEPILAGHPKENSLPTTSILGYGLRAPIWVSSMTGGTELAPTINKNLARACQEFGMGMGLGSCRSILRSDERLEDFDVRAIMGNAVPLYANLGIAQVEQLLFDDELYLVDALLEKLQADGLIIHVNPMQEWLQPEGDHIQQSPLKTIQDFMAARPATKIIVKEVGQGMGYESLKALFQLPIEAVDFAASGGTNFAKLELLRSNPSQQLIFEQIAHLGHSAAEMVVWSNAIQEELGDQMKCKQLIISGGVQNFLDGYYLTQKSTINSIYGQASAFLQHARADYASLRQYVAAQIRGLELANAFLRVK
ncbi:MAG: isopentenyl-diphosphate delta-isomerase [Bacteroidota bacterium]